MALKLIESEARKLMRQHPNLKEFVMTMGTAFFYDKHNQIIDSYEYRYLESFSKMLYDFDERFKVVGVPMRFTADGEMITDW